MHNPEDDIDPVEGLPSRAHPPAWGRYDERAAQPDTSVKDEDIPPRDYAIPPADLLRPMQDPEAVHYRMMDKVGAYHALCLYEPRRPRAHRMAWAYNPNHVTCEACQLSLETQRLQRLVADKKRQEGELRKLKEQMRRQDLTSADRAKELLDQQGPLPHMYDQGKPELRRMDEANRIARAQVWATLAIAEAMTRDEPEEVETVFRSTQGPITKEQGVSRATAFDRLWQKQMAENKPAQTHYTVHTDGSITDNMTGKTYDPGEKLMDVLTDSAVERVPVKPAYSMPDGPMVIHYTRPMFDWNKAPALQFGAARRHAEQRLAIRRSRQRYQ